MKRYSMISLFMAAMILLHHLPWLNVSSNINLRWNYSACTNSWLKMWQILLKNRNC